MRVTQKELCDLRRRVDALHETRPDLRSPQQAAADRETAQNNLVEATEALCRAMWQFRRSMDEVEESPDGERLGGARVSESVSGERHCASSTSRGMVLTANDTQLLEAAETILGLSIVYLHGNGTGSTSGH
eukprot:TRINITY_DN2679_c0_g4_i1.p2 TRINITY_DN2679_c0_g4~~TRINITY_DN2679_c0_g4_i1.p2  ORF type:complete len:131 (-),score=22.13 TRINITY_DN2679_c0_g4_i1:487-879(-)